MGQIFQKFIFFKPEGISKLKNFYDWAFYDWDLKSWNEGWTSFLQLLGCFWAKIVIIPCPAWKKYFGKQILFLLSSSVPAGLA